jgi:integrase
MTSMLRKAIVTIYVRHQATCQHDGKPFFRGCDCPKWLRYSGDACLCGRSHKGRQHRFAAGVRSWAQAEEKREEAQKRLDAGESTPLPKDTETQKTIKQAIETFIRAKEGEQLSNATIRKLRYQLSLFDSFMADRSRFFPSEITSDDVIEYRATWKWKSGVTRQKGQQNLRGFLRSCCKENLKDLLENLKPIKLSKTDTARLEPQPFTEEELKRLLAHVPKIFDAVKAPRVTAFIHLQVATGLAIRDAVQLERDHIKDGWLRIRRQKTDKPVRQKLDTGLFQELLTVANSNPRYVFWNGTSLPESATGLWQEDLRTLMKSANLWIKGNLSHRFRDTAVDFWLGQGWTLTDVADALGDTVAIVERHYKSLESKRAEERLAKLPVRSWAEVMD